MSLSASTVISSCTSDKNDRSETFVRPLTVIRDDEEIEVFVAQRDIGEEGVVVWDAALVLAYFLVNHQKRFNLYQGIHVVELGAGTGVVGLVAAALGARSTLTDLDRLIPLLNETIDLNSETLKHRLSARCLHWGDKDHSAFFRDHVPDLILVADCIYYEASVDPLIETLKTLTSYARCPILLSYEVRDEFEDKRQVKEKFFAHIQEEFVVTQFETSDCHPDYSADDIKVVRIDRREH